MRGGKACCAGRSWTICRTRLSRQTRWSLSAPRDSTTGTSPARCVQTVELMAALAAPAAAVDTHLGLHELNLSDYVWPALLRRNRWNIYGQPRAWSPSGGGCREAADRPDDVRTADARHRRRDVRLHREVERSNTSRDGLRQNVLWRVGSDGICDQIFAAVLEAVWPSGQVQVHFSLPIVPWVRDQSSLALRSRSCSE